VNATPGPTATSTTASATCGNANGGVDVTVTGGAPPFTYAWSNGITEEDLLNLLPGDYTVSIVDASDCEIVVSATVTGNDGPVLTYAVQDASCGQANGSITTMATGGTTPYTYAWSNGQTAADALDVPAGSYDLLLTDANGCTAALQTIPVSDAAGPAVTGATMAPTCGGANGSIVLTVVGGATPYDIVWSDSSNGLALENVDAGTYDVTVTDANGCVATQSTAS